MLSFRSSKNWLLPCRGLFTKVAESMGGVPQVRPDCAFTSYPKSAEMNRNKKARVGDSFLILYGYKGATIIESGVRTPINGFGITFTKIYGVEYGNRIALPTKTRIHIEGAVLLKVRVVHKVIILRGHLKNKTVFRVAQIPPNTVIPVRAGMKRIGVDNWVFRQIIWQQVISRRIRDDKVDPKRPRRIAAFRADRTFIA